MQALPIHGAAPGDASPVSLARQAAQQALFLLSDGQPGQALRAALDGLALGHPTTELHNIAGVCAATLGEHERAAACWRRAVALAPLDAQAYRNLGLLAQERACPDEAEQWYRQALERDPANADVHARLGALLAMRNQDDEAERCYRLALTHEPGDAATCSNLGILLARQGRDDEAAQCYRRALTLEPDNGATHCNLGVLLAKLGRFDEAERHYRGAIALVPDGAQAHANLALLLEALGRADEAEQCQRRALARAPASAQIHVNLGNLLAAGHRDDEAEQCYRRAIALAADMASAHSNLGVLLTERGREDEAEQCFLRALELNPRYPLARLNLGYLLLRQGRFAEGWPHHEARNDPGLPDAGAAPPAFPFPQWRGQSLAGKSLLMWPEQGLGDIIQFCRYAPLLKRRGAARVTLACRAPLASLMRTLDGVDAVLALGDPAVQIGVHDYWTFTQSVPLCCDTGLDTIPAPIPYLRAAPEKMREWAPRLPAGGARVGLAWRGNPGHANDRHRSLPGKSTLAPLWSVPGARFVSLQMGGRGEADAAAPPLTDLGAAIGDFADMAAIIEQLDLVICVDTAIAHLAGALGKPCWVLLPAYKTDWRWLRARDDSPWYPGAMRLFRQRAIGDWTAVVAEVTAALRERLA